MIQLNHGYTFFVTTELAGVATAADSTPTAVLYRNGTASGVAVTVASTATTGLYKITFTSLGTGDGWAITDVLHLTATATIDAVSGYVSVVWDSTGDVDAVMRGTDSAITTLGTNAPADWLNAAALSADAVTEIQSGLATQATVDAIDAVTSQFVFTVANQVDANALTGGGSVDLTPVLAKLPESGRAASQQDVADISGDFLAYPLTKGSAGTIERAFWQILKTQASTDGEIVDNVANTASRFDTNLIAADSQYDHQIVVFVSGDLQGESRPIDTFASSGGVIVLQEALTAEPSGGDEFLILPDHVHPISEIQDGLARTNDVSQETLLLIKAKTDLITSQSANVNAQAASTITITRGDSSSNAITVGTDYTGYTATFTIRHRVTDAVLLSVSATVTSSTLLTVTLATTDTEFALLVSDDEFGAHPYDIQLVSGSTQSTEFGIAVIRRDMTRI